MCESHRDIWDPGERFSLRPDSKVPKSVGPAISGLRRQTAQRFPEASIFASGNRRRLSIAQMPKAGPGASKRNT